MSSAQFYILRSKVTHCHLEHSYKLGDVDCREGEFNIPRHKLSEYFFLTLDTQCPPCDFYLSKDGFVIERLQKMMLCLSFLLVSLGLPHLSK